MRPPRSRKKRRRPPRPLRPRRRPLRRRGDRVRAARVVQPAPANAPKQTAPGARPAASPAVRRRADELGVKLQYVPGTGPEGRITHQDLDTFVASGGKGAAVAKGKVARTG